MSVDRIDSHVDDALERLLAQYQGRPNMAALVGVFAQAVQQLEDGLHGLGASFNLSTAVGAQLDALGGIVGEERNGLTDDQYRALLRGTIAQNNGDATIETLLSIIRGLFQTEAIFVKQPNSLKHAPQAAAATLTLGIGDPTVPDNVLAIVQKQLAKVTAAGVQLVYLSRFEAEAGAFACAGKQSWVRGLGSIHDASIGGKAAALLNLEGN